MAIDHHFEVARRRGLDVIKINVEGGEVVALRDAAGTVRRFRPLIVVDCNRAAARRSGTIVEDLDDLLASFGYDRFTFRNRLARCRLDELDTRSNAEAAVDVYCFPRR